MGILFNRLQMEVESKLINLLRNINLSLTVPDSLTEQILRTCGIECRDKQIVRLVSAAANCLVSRIVKDAAQRVENASHLDTLEGPLKYKDAHQKIRKYAACLGKRPTKDNHRDE